MYLIHISTINFYYNMNHVTFVKQYFPKIRSHIFTNVEKDIEDTRLNFQRSP